MNFSLTALILVALLIAWLLIRRRQQAKAEDSASVSRLTAENTTYHAVSIKFATNACQAAKEMEGRRFLSTAAPKLPLPDCDAAECSCRFVHHKDRRSGKDRRSPFGAPGFGTTTGRFKTDQRAGKDRRAGADEDRF